MRIGAFQMKTSANTDINCAKMIKAIRLAADELHAEKLSGCDNGSAQ